MRYFLAIETTRRRLASTISCLARCSPRSMRFASSTSCAAVSRSTLPMSFRKSCSESVVTSRGSSTGRSSSSRPVDDLDLLLLERVVEVVELRGVELELPQRERNLLRAQRPGLAARLQQPLGLVRLQHLGDCSTAWPVPPARSLASLPARDIPHAAAADAALSHGGRTDAIGRTAHFSVSRSQRAASAARYCRRLLAEQRVRALVAEPAGAACGRPSTCADQTQHQAEVEADGLGVREDAHERAEPAERARRVRLVEEADRSGGACVGVVGRQARGGGELPLGRDAAGRAAAARRRRGSSRGRRRARRLAERGDLPRSRRARGSGAAAGTTARSRGRPGANCGWRKSPARTA